jgi:hypothetical protein
MLERITHTAESGLAESPTSKAKLKIILERDPHGRAPVRRKKLGSIFVRRSHQSRRPQQ